MPSCSAPWAQTCLRPCHALLARLETSCFSPHCDFLQNTCLRPAVRASSSIGFVGQHREALKQIRSSASVLNGMQWSGYQVFWAPGPAFEPHHRVQAVQSCRHTCVSGPRQCSLSGEDEVDRCPVGLTTVGFASFSKFISAFLMGCTCVVPGSLLVISSCWFPYQFMN